MDSEFEPQNEREINGNLDQKDFKPYDPNDKHDPIEEKQIENDQPNTQANETNECPVVRPDGVPPVDPTKGKGDTIINIPQQSEKKNPPKSQPKSAKSDGKFWEKLNQGIKEFVKGFNEFFVKSDEQINREIKKKQYKNTRFEK